MYEWHIGDPVDWGDGFMDAQNQGYGNDDGIRVMETTMRKMIISQIN